MVGVHIGELDVHHESQLALGFLFSLSYSCVDNALRLLSKARVARHLHRQNHTDYTHISFLTQ